LFKSGLLGEYEIIAVDDGSTDQTYEVLKKYEKKHSNFFIYRHNINKKAPATRNTAILHCRGEYIFNLDSDDILLPDSVQKLYNYMEKHGLDLGYFGKYHYFNDFNPKKITIRATGNQKGPIYTIFDCAQTAHIPATCGCRLYTKKSWSVWGIFRS